MPDDRVTARRTPPSVGRFARWPAVNLPGRLGRLYGGQVFVKIAVIGSGISGLSAAYLLAPRHDVTLYERDERLGGHAHTHQVTRDGVPLVVDTGFMVFNERTYPHFVRLLRELGVRGRPSDMSFGVRCRRCGLKYASRHPGTLFAQPSRLVDRGHWRMLGDILRFFRDARRFLASDAGYDVTLGAFLAGRGYGAGLVRHFLLPMGGAIWSASYGDMREFPARSLFQFYANHGLLAPTGAPVWQTVVGGSRAYVEAIASRLGHRVRLGEGATRLERDAGGVTIAFQSGATARFDKVVVATHADQALGLLADPSPEEQELLGRFRYSRNRTVLHTDRQILPARRAAWASWNCDVDDCTDERAPASLTYHLNRLQGLVGSDEICVSLNDDRIRPEHVIAEMDYAHPILDRTAIEAQPRIEAMNGARHTYYCGAHLRYGFHEDGLVSAVAVARRLGVIW